jgi:hypothetical protein
MNRRDFLRISGAGLSALALPGMPAGAPERKTGGTQPNIILILGDDVGLSEIGCCGSDHYLTPHIDRLAEAGIRFEFSFPCRSTDQSAHVTLLQECTFA